MFIPYQATFSQVPSYNKEMFIETHQNIEILESELLTLNWPEPKAKGPGQTKQ
jgi:hypothetical protein